MNDKPLWLTHLMSLSPRHRAIESRNTVPKWTISYQTRSPPSPVLSLFTTSRSPLYSSSVLRPLSSVLRPLSSVLCPPSSVLCPLSSVPGRHAMRKKSEKTVYTFRDEMLDEHTGSFGSGPALSYQFRFAALFRQRASSTIGTWTGAMLMFWDKTIGRD